jgi:hypothetical protein
MHDDAGDPEINGRAKTLDENLARNQGAILTRGLKTTMVVGIRRL